MKTLRHFEFSCAYATPLHGDFIPTVGKRVQDEPIPLAQICTCSEYADFLRG